jgi:hypothetical protein
LGSPSVRGSIIEQMIEVVRQRPEEELLAVDERTYLTPGWRLKIYREGPGDWSICRADLPANVHPRTLAHFHTLEEAKYEALADETRIELNERIRRRRRREMVAA